MDSGEVSAVEANARVYNNTLSGSSLASTAHESAALGVGTFALVDNRDGNDYLVRRLADGNCWMVQNLDLDLKTFAGTNNLTSDNTNLNSKTTWDPSANLKGAGGYANHLGLTDSLEPGPGYDTVGTLSIDDYQFQSKGSFGPNLYWGSRYQAGTTTDNSGTANNNGLVIANNANSDYARSYNNDLGYITGESRVVNATTCATYTSSQTSGHDECRMPGAIGNQGGDKTKATQSTDGLTQDTKWQPEYISTTGGTETNGSDTFTMRGSMYIGDYYNWYAVTAESGSYSTTGGTTAQDDICPKGWRLPVNDASTDGSWTKLVRTTYGLTGSGYGNGASIAKVMQLPLSIPMAGYYHWASGALGARGYRGYYWSSTASSGTNAYNLHFNYSGYFLPQDSYDKVNGFTVRCVSHGDELKSTESQSALASATTCSAGNICYNANGGTGTMSDQSASASSSVVLTAPTFVRTGYSFAGWSTQDNGFGTVYGPNETITTPDTLGTTGLQLYAKWLPSSGTMQDFTSTQCNALGTHQSVALTDNRDGNTYTVTKLKDGNCWMTTNLALNLADFAGKSTGTLLTTENTDIGNGTRTDLLTTTVVEDGQSKTITYWDPENGADSESVPSLRQSVNDVIGGSYNSYAASAGTTYKTQQSAVVSDSLCPKEWKLPTEDQAYDLLNAEYGFTTSGHNNLSTQVALRQAPFNAIGTNSTAGTIPVNQISANGEQQVLYWDANGFVSVQYGIYKSSFTHMRCVK